MCHTNVALFSMTMRSDKTLVHMNLCRRKISIIYSQTISCNNDLYMRFQYYIRGGLPTIKNKLIITLTNKLTKFPPKWHFFSTCKKLRKTRWWNVKFCSISFSTIVAFGKKFKLVREVTFSSNKLKRLHFLVKLRRYIVLQQFLTIYQLSVALVKKCISGWKIELYESC